MNSLELSNDMVLIKEVGEVRVINNTGRWGELQHGFHIIQPLSGFVNKEWWDSINIFQNINVEKSEVIEKIVKSGKEITKEDLLKYTDLQKWLDLQNNTRNFFNTIVEFNILVGINRDGSEEYRRTFCELGKIKWGVVDESNKQEK